MRKWVVFAAFLLSTCGVFGGNGVSQGSSPDGLSTATEEAPQDAPKIDVAKLPLLDQARRHAAEFMDDLPNFVVTQIVTRSVRTPKKRIGGNKTSWR